MALSKISSPGPKILTEDCWKFLPSPLLKEDKWEPQVGGAPKPSKGPTEPVQSDLEVLIEDLRHTGHQSEQGSVSSSLFVTPYWWMATFLHGQCTGHFYYTQTQSWDITAEAICPEKLVMHSV